MTALIIINSFAILWIIFHKDFTIRKKESFGEHTFFGLCFFYKNIEFIYIPFRNERKVILREDVKKLLKYDDQKRRQILYTRFSWIKISNDIDQSVKEFVKDYEKVDKEYVNKLVSDFNAKKCSK